MRRTFLVAAAITLFVLGVVVCTTAQTAAGPVSDNVHLKSLMGHVVQPKSNAHLPADRGVRAHTNLEVFMLATGRPNELPPYSGYGFETPASVACIYGFVSATSGCNPNTTTTNPTGGAKAIAIVDAFDDPWAGPDLAYFSAQFGLPFKPSQLQVVYASGSEPMIDESGGWELEESLDIEWAHAMAPNATIYLVEADSNDMTDLLNAVVVATNLVQCGQTTTCSSVTGAGEVSMSWSSDEFSNEATYDTYFSKTNVVFFASAGDSPGTGWPCTSKYVVCVGGTSTRRSTSSGNYIAQSTWTLGGGGVSFYEALPTYQSGVTGVGTRRSVPDISFDANPTTGAWVWDSNFFEETGGGWFIVGGTSLSSPAMAGVINVAGAKTTFASSGGSELSRLYTNRANSAYYARPTSGGYCGPYEGWTATGTLGNWDPCVGLGVPVGYGGK